MHGIVTESELTVAQKWFGEAFSAQSLSPEVYRFPLSFRYRKQESATILAKWKIQRDQSQSRDDVNIATITLTDPDTGLQCRCEVTTFTNFPAVEWVAYLKNTGQTDTPLIEDIQALDWKFPLERVKYCWVHHANGDQAMGGGDYAPLQTQLFRLQGSSDSFTMKCVGGRSSYGTLPFFNLQLGEDGVIGAIGWSGAWKAMFYRDSTGVRVSTGMKKTHLRLHPDEEIRTPRILILFWEGDRIRSQNILRRFILAHHSPRPHGKPVQVPISDNNWGERTEADHLARIRWLEENRIPVEQYWIDAGWYGDYEIDSTKDTFNISWAIRAGSWYPNKSAYPRGFKAIGDRLRELGLGFVLWFEPERVFEGTQIAREHPEWLLGPHRIDVMGGNNYLFNLGIPEARRYITDKISNLIEEGGVTCYRQDANWLEPNYFLDAADAPDRQGIGEIRYIEGLYAFYDELLARNPGLLIDNCATGGKRIDLEIMSRSVLLHRSDEQVDTGYDPIVAQTQTQGLASWVPLFTALCPEVNRYMFRSALAPGMNTNFSLLALERGEKVPVELARTLMQEFHEVRKYFYGDFYPLLSYSPADNVWAAWQFDRPDLGAGIVLVFRRRKSPAQCMTIELHGLDIKIQYEVRSRDNGDTYNMTGMELMRNGLCIEIGDKPGSVLYEYKRLN